MRSNGNPGNMAQMPFYPKLEQAMKLVIIESPYAGDILRNKSYAARCIRDSLERGEAPFASHMLYTQQGILYDHIPAQRMTGIEAGYAWMGVADLVAVYTDLGISPGMEQGIKAAEDIRGMPIEYRAFKDPDFYDSQKVDASA